MMKSFNLQTKAIFLKQQKGAVLLEALIAILIFSFGILAISGLQGAMVKHTSNAKYRADASFIAQQTIGQMWANPANLNSYIVNSTTTGALAYDISDQLPGGTRTIAFPATGQALVTIGWQEPSDPDAHTHVVNARITSGS